MISKWGDRETCPSAALTHGSRLVSDLRLSSLALYQASQVSTRYYCTETILRQDHRETLPYCEFWAAILSSFFLIQAVAEGKLFHTFPYLPYLFCFFWRNKRSKEKLQLTEKVLNELRSRESIVTFMGRLRGLHTINCEGATADLKTDIFRSS